jgi:LemA protein
MKRVLFNLIAFVGLASMSSCGYNSMVEKQENVESQWANVETQYQRRADLIGNMVETVKAESDFVKSTLLEVAQARASATQIKIDPKNLTEENIAAFQRAQDGLSGALSKLLSIQENYPDLKTDHFRDFRVTLEGTENRIAVARRDYNLAVQDYNSYIRKFPNNMTAGWFDFDKKGYFKAEAGSEKAPKVDFKSK